MVKRGLGKGLQALIPETEEKENSIEIKIRDIKPNQYQPRKEFDQDKLQELADSIKEHGLIQPIIVTPYQKGYQIVAGERRWRAANMLDLESIPAVIKEYTQQQLMEIALIENLQREDLNDIEEAKAYKQLMDEFSLTQEEIAKRLGKSRSFIANTLRLLTLSHELQELIQNHQLSAGHGRALLAIESQKTRRVIAKKAVDEKLSVREIEKLVQHLKKDKVTPKAKTRNKSPFILELEDNLQRVLGTKVSISNKNKKGKIEIEYYSQEDLERILELLSAQ